tara:strand:- start:23767 stop:23916 length:150 start_codon:yes stop_codon:yes gene_type:complete
MVLDSLKTTMVGTGGIAVTWMEWLPLTVRVAVGIATFIYLCIKIYKELK